jgi:hypothetical protein
MSAPATTIRQTIGAFWIKLLMLIKKLGQTTLVSPATLRTRRVIALKYKGLHHRPPQPDGRQRGALEDAQHHGSGVASQPPGPRA